MADDITLNSGSGGDTLAADDILGVKYQRVKISVGADGAAADNSTAAPLAVKISDGTDVALVTAGGLLQVDASGAAIPVTDNGGALTVDGAVTVSGTVTAELSAVDNAVLDNIDADLTTVIGHVDGIEGLLTTMDADTGGILTSVQLIDDAVYAEDVAAQAGDKGIAILAVRRDADTALVGTDNDYANLQVDANGYLKVEIFDGGGSHTVDNAGTFAVQVDGSALTALQLIDDPVIADDAAFTPGTSKVGAVGLFADETSPDSVNEGDIGIPRMTLDRMAVVTPRPSATGEGLTIFRSLDLDETEEEIKATAGKLYGYYFFNAATATRYLKFYNATAANVTVGTTTPVLTLPLPTGVAGHVEFSLGIPFSTAITAAATTGLADNDTGTPGANEIIINVFYA